MTAQRCMMDILTLKGSIPPEYFLNVKRLDLCFFLVLAPPSRLLLISLTEVVCSTLHSYISGLAHLGIVTEIDRSRARPASDIFHSGLASTVDGRGGGASHGKADLASPMGVSIGI